MREKKKGNKRGLGKEEEKVGKKKRRKKKERINCALFGNQWHNGSALNQSLFILAMAA